MNKNTVFIILCLVIIAGGVFAFLYYRDTIFSKEILKLEILGPDTAKVGDEIEYTIKYKNNGNFALENPKLIFELPENSLTEDSKNRLERSLKDIYPGNEDIVKFKARLLGKEGDLKTARVWLSYTPHNLSARYESDTTFTTKIETVPITLTFDMPLKAEKGKEINYDINYFSNIDYPLENLSIKLDTENGFNVESADPASLDNVEWKLDTLQKAQGGRIRIKGLVSADTGNSVHFSASLGMWINGTFVVIKEATQDLEIISPLLFISQQVNGSANYTATSGQTLHYQIFIRNIGATPFNNVFVTSSLSGSAFDMPTLTSFEGIVMRDTNSVVFDYKQLPKLQHLAPQSEVSVTFDVQLKGAFTPADSERNNVVLKNVVNASGISQEFETKVNSNLAVVQKAYYSNGQGFQNSGPIPPEAGKTTTYTITWQAKNYFNDTKNVKIRAVLPQNVTLTAILPESQISQFSLDSASREMVWSVGDLAAGTGVSNSGPSISFQISLTPTELQRGGAASLVGIATISGEDQSTGKLVSTTAPALNTGLLDEQGSTSGIVR